MPYRDIKLQNKYLDEIAGGCKSFFDSIISEASIATFIKTYYSKYPSIRNRPCFPSLNTPSLEGNYQKIPFSFINISDDAIHDTYTIIALGRKYHLSPQSYKLISKMQVGKSYSGKQLLEIFHESSDSWASVAVAVQSLLDDGLISKRGSITSS